MAEAVLYNIAQELLNKLGSAAIEEVASAWGYKHQLAKLKNTISTIKDVLLDAEERQVSSHAVRGWLQRLRTAVYEADDLFDKLSSLAMQKKALGGSKFSKEVYLFFSKYNQFYVGSVMAREITKIRECLDDIAKDSGDFGLRLKFDEDRKMSRNREQSYSFVRKEEIVGRESDLRGVLDMLLNDEDVFLVPIVGIGGLGKTTLAQLVFNDERVGCHFELRMWVCVSDTFDVKDIIEKILTSATNEKPNELEMEQLQKQLRRVIGGKRYLLVLDDVWNEDREKWLMLRSLLLCGGVGSKILVTTRSRQVASIMGTGLCYDLRHLSEAESWSLFCKMAFESGQETRDQELVSTGKEIMKKCANVPLAIRAIGSLVYAKDRKKWLSFKDNELAEIAETDHSIMPILKLSYKNLHSSLKHCFAYCALFPKDYDLDKETLINLWIAEGFIVPSCGTQSLEDAGEEYFMDLLQRCFFQDIKRDAQGNITSVRIHDLMHDLAQKEAGAESVVLKLISDSRNFNKNTHHLSLGYNLTSLWTIPSCLRETSHLRTFFLPQQAKLGTRIRKSVSDQLISNYSRLRVLDLSGLGIEELPNSVGDLIHLRYLDLSFNSHIKTLPNAMSRLQNLQVLKLSKCYRLRMLPRDIKCLVNLRSLDLDECNALTHMPAGIGRLTALQKLSQFIAGNQNAFFNLRRFAQLSDLSSLNNLKGNLDILLMGKWESAMSEAKAAKLSSKLQISKLVLDFFAASRLYHEPLLKGLQPHKNLRILAITYYGGENYPSWARFDNLCSFLPNLVEIYISNCNRCPYLPTFSKLQYLKRLHITYAHSVEYVESTEPPSPPSPTFFPSLEDLTLDRMGNVRGWWRRGVGTDDDDRHVNVATAASQRLEQEYLPWFPRLSKLHLRNCAKLRSMPLFPFVEELKLVNLHENLSVRKALETFATLSSLPLFPSPSDTTLNARLKSLEIDNADHFISLPKEYLQNLSSLGLWQCCDLVNLSVLAEGLKYLPSLSSLSFYHCDQLTSLSGGLHHLTSLRELSVRKCKELNLLEDKDGMPWKAFTSLCTLRLRFLPQMFALPEGLQHVTSLQFLEIVGADNLTNIPDWFGSMSMLQWLSIRECSKLMSLPESFCNLTKLKELEITACPRLTKRCRGPLGEDWPKIQHIPSVVVRESFWDNA